MHTHAYKPMYVSIDLDIYVHVCLRAYQILDFICNWYKFFTSGII